MEASVTGEHLLIGRIGSLFTILSFIASLFSLIAYCRATRSIHSAVPWKKIARKAFFFHCICVTGMICLLLWMMCQRYFEYAYVWRHTDRGMPVQYIISALWEGQEGSFLLWAFWQALVGCVLIMRAGQWEAPVMSVFSSVQFFLTSMLLGISIGGWTIGSNPFALLLSFNHAPFNMADFLKSDHWTQLNGRGMHPLLQNFWMVIHPPVLFLGYALTLAPFSYAVAGLWKRQLIEWVKPALPWTFAGIMLLGAGILMGGVWAYESLDFGGFWAWDPVENSALVPWLILVAAGHIMLINRKKTVSLFSLYFLSVIPFILVLYAAFLTRSGILGDASAHAFTDRGMTAQLVIFLLFYFILALYLWIKNHNIFLLSHKEEALWSREFWIFAACIALSLSAFQIFFTTSVPVINAVFGSDIAPPSSAVAHYNAWQAPLSVIICLLTGFVQFVAYKHSNIKHVLKILSLYAGISLLLAVSVLIRFKMIQPLYIAVLFSSLFALTANAGCLFRNLNAGLEQQGASIAHMGVGLIICGVLITGTQKQIISENHYEMKPSVAEAAAGNQETLLLYKNDTLSIGNYLVTYSGKHSLGTSTYYILEYLLNRKGQKPVPAFTMEPSIRYHAGFGEIAEPDIKHFLSYDFYTHIVYAQPGRKEKHNGNFLEYANDTLKPGDTIRTHSALIVLDGVSGEADRNKFKPWSGDTALRFSFSVYDTSGVRHRARSVFALKDTASPDSYAAIIPGTQLALTGILPDQHACVVSFAENKHNRKDYIIIKSIVFPWINILWAGCVFMVTGTFLGVYKRMKKTK